jgi:hypothetical protein
MVTGTQLGGHLFALEQHDMVGLVGRKGNCLINKRLVGDDPARLQPAGGGEDHLRFRIGNARCKFRRGKAAEHHGVDGADARTSQHAESGLRDHRHVEDHPVATAHAKVFERGSKAGHFILHLPIGEALLRTCIGTVKNDGRAITVPGGDMPVDGIPARVAGGADEPTVKPVHLGLYCVPGA